MSKYTKFLPRIRSRHPSHNTLREKGIFPFLPFKSVVRLGSFTDMKDSVTNGGNRIELNTIQAIKNSANKGLMKTCFSNNNIITADWWSYGGEWDGSHAFFLENNSEEAPYELSDLPFPIISKNIFGSRGKGNIKHDNIDSLLKFIEQKGDKLKDYIFEKFYNYNREYRLHVTEEGCFYTCRKMLKQDTPEEKRWYRNNDHCVWFMEDNEKFDKPKNWDIIVKESVEALKAVGLDFGAIDLRIQSSKNKEGIIREDPKFIIVEINSAPSFGEKTLIKYIEIIPKLLINKYKKNE